ncbi:MAG: hypothetical protein WC666_00770 [Candidatus Paceibacterota bacterium]
MEKVKSLKKDWVIGLHHNRHDYHFSYNPLFDFSMAGEEDLIEKDGKDIPLVTMDACNFVPECFKSSPSGEKFWDILYIARAVRFKKIPEFFQCIRKLYNSGKKYRVLFICPVPPYKRSERRTVFYDIRKVYDGMFNEEEKNLFTLLTINYRHPFPFDLDTLSHFYKSSKIFVHFASDERRCRVASYAWKSGLPVVGMSCVGSLLPKELRIKPYFYEVNDYEDFNTLIPEAITESQKMKELPENKAQTFFDLEDSKKRLGEELNKIFVKNGLKFENKELFDKNLDIRLGRHVNIGSGPNSVPINFERFLEVLSSPQLREMIPCETVDPETKIAESFKEKQKDGLLNKIISFIKIKK